MISENKHFNPARIILYEIFAIALLTILVERGTISTNLYTSILYAAVITTLNFGLGLLSIKIGLEKSPKGFIVAFLGGMMVRLFLMLAMVFICLKFLDLSRNNFIFSILFLYVFYLIIEILYLISKKNL